MSERRGGGTRTLDRLWSAHEIEQLAYRYAWAYDSRDRDLFLSLWAPVREPSPLPDIDWHTVRQSIDDFFSVGPSVMLVANHLIDFDSDDRATGLVYGVPQIELDGTLVDQMVTYHDRYVRIEGRWLFEVRRHRLVYGQERAENPFQLPVADWPTSQTGRGVTRADRRSYPPRAERISSESGEEHPG